MKPIKKNIALALCCLLFMLDLSHVLAQDATFVNGPVTVTITQPARLDQRFTVTEPGYTIRGTITFDPAIVQYWKVEIKGSGRSFIGSDLFDRTLAYDWVTMGTTRTDQVTDGQLAFIPPWPTLSTGSWRFRLVVVGYDDTFVIPAIEIPFSVPFPPMTPVPLEILQPTTGQVMASGIQIPVVGTIEMNQFATQYQIEILGGRYTNWQVVDSHSNDVAHPTRIDGGMLGALPGDLPDGQYLGRLVVLGLDGNYLQNPIEFSFSIGTGSISNLPTVEITYPPSQSGALTLGGYGPLVGTVWIPQGASYYKVEIRDYTRLEANQQPRFRDWTTIGTTHSQSVVNGQIESLSLPNGRYFLRILIVNPDSSYAGDPIEYTLLVRDPRANDPRPPIIAPVTASSATVQEAAQPEGTVVHVVQQGETLFRIALAYGVTVDELLALNNIPNRDLIYPGQQIIVRTGGT